MGDPTTLVVGVGSELRRDDAVGRVVAERIDGLGYPGVSVESLTQLVPELVEAMVTVDRVVFVDAAVDADEVVVQQVSGRHTGLDSHHGDPASLVALAGTIGGPVPEAYVVRVPTTDLDLGTGLSAGCEAHVDDAVAAVVELVVTPRSRRSRPPGSATRAVRPPRTPDDGAG